MSAVAFPERLIRTTVSVTRAATGTSTYVWEQNRQRVGIRSGGAQMGNAHVEVYGVPLADMNNIARLFLETLTPQNTDTIQIDAWNGQSWTPFFQGVITWSYADASAMPDVRLVIDANASFALANTSSAPYANAGPVTLQAVLTALAAQGGFTLNYTASAPQYQLTDVRLTGSPLDQIGEVMRYFPDLKWWAYLQQIIVSPVLAPIGTDAIRIAVDTGLQASPVYSTSGLQITTLFNPQIRPGVTLDVETQFDFVNRTVWVANVLEHQLDSNVPGGVWNTYVAANSYGAKGNNDGNTPNT